MTENEIYQEQGKLIALKNQKEELEISGNNSLITIYNKVNPINIDSSICELDIKSAKVEMDQLYDTWLKVKELDSKIRKIESRLGIIKKALQ